MPWHAAGSARRSLFGRLLPPALLAAALPFLGWNGFTAQLNAQWTDLMFRLRGPVDSKAARRIVLVAIDDRTAARYGPLPLSRAKLAAGLERIAAAQPRAAGLDLLFAEPSGPGEDEPLARAVAALPNTVTAAALASDPGAGPAWILPLPNLRAHVAHVHAAPDPDGNVRSVMLKKEADRRRYWAFGLELARLALGAGPPVEAGDGVVIGGAPVPGPALAINYAGPEGSFERVPFGAVLDGTAPGSVFRDKIVIVGVTAQGGGDRQFTPVSSGIGMSGIEIHANAVRTILDGAFLRTPGAPAEAGCFAAAAALAFFAARKLRGLRLSAALAAGAVGIPGACMAAFRAGTLLPVAGILAAFAAAAAVSLASEFALTAAELKTAGEQRKELAFRMQAVAHEIKTPLTAIRGSSEMLADNCLPDGERAHMAGLIYKESVRLTELVKAFLDVERMAAGALELRKQSVDGRGLCAEVVERARLFAARKRTRIEADVPAFGVNADPELLAFALYNLLTNAVKYSPKESEVLVQARAAGGMVRISVSDRGDGITPPEREKIFEKFYRMKRDRTREEGTGIGLALAREIAVQHGGAIELDSRPGGGSVFTLVLPEAGG